jgi:lipooligosaccharide transport system permease protein
MPRILWSLAPLLPCIQALPTTALFDGARLALLTGKVSPVYLANLLASAGISFFLALRFFEKKKHG